MSNVEAVFHFNELFFSKTDLKGKILSGNDVFKRISGYSWPELINKPHNVIRHNDMPRGVFYLFWKTIQSQQPIGAYVKNRSKDGSYYWVFALALPVDDVYLSIRLKPSSPYFNVIKTEYEKLLRLELSEKLTPEQSQQKLLLRIKELGFESYELFMTAALTAELNARQEKLNLSPISALKSFSQINEINTKLIKESNKMSEKFNSSSLIPLNLTIQSSRLNTVGGPLAVVAEKYSQMATEIKDEFLQFEKAITDVQTELKKCEFLISSCLLQAEVLSVFKNEKTSELNNEVDMKLLKDVSSKGLKHASSALNSVGIEVDKLKTACEKLKTVSTGLEIIRLMGKMEISKVGTNQDQLNPLVDQLDVFKNVLLTSIQIILTGTVHIKSLTEDISSNLNNH